MRRHLLGFIGLLFVLVWAYSMLSGASSGPYAFATASCQRIGFVLIALWLALPQLEQMKLRWPPWLLASLAVGGLIIAVRPRAAMWVLPLGAALAALQFVGWLFKPLPTANTKTGKRRKP